MQLVFSLALQSTAAAHVAALRAHGLEVADRAVADRRRVAAHGVVVIHDLQTASLQNLLGYTVGRLFDRGRRL